MDKKRREKLLKMAAKKMVYENASYKLKKDKNPILDLLQSHFGPNKVYYGATLPYYVQDIDDIVFGMNDDQEALEIPFKFKHDLDIACLPTEVDWYCIVMLKTRQLNQVGGLLGPARHKVSHLVKLGYKVLVLRPWQWRKAQNGTFQGDLHVKDFLKMCKTASGSDSIRDYIPSPWEHRKQVGPLE